MIIVTVGLACQVELPVAGGYVWAGVLVYYGSVIVADHDCIYWLYLYDPVSLWSCIPIYFSTTHYTQYHESCHFQASVNAWRPDSTGAFSRRNAKYFACFFWIVSNQVEIIYSSGRNSKETGEIIRISPRKSARGIRPWAGVLFKSEVHQDLLFIHIRLSDMTFFIFWFVSNYILKKFDPLKHETVYFLAIYCARRSTAFALYKHFIKQSPSS
jgi:hypothetical protein